MSLPPQNKAKAQQLKAAGNELYTKKNFQAAYAKFSEAIDLDSENAIFYANRAAASLAMKEYLQAGSDCERAVQLDPTYVKAWARLAAAAKVLCSWKTAERATRSGLSLLPVESKLSTVEETLKAELEGTLIQALLHMQDGKATYSRLPRAAEEFPSGPVVISSKDIKDLPWMRALANENEMIAQARGSNFSSGFVILHAYQEFTEGTKHMRTVMITKSRISGWNGAIAEISNAIIRDPRVFHADAPDWVDKYNDQVRFECQDREAWNEGGPNVVRKEAVERLKTKGWDSVRRAVTVTVRLWIMAGFVNCSLGKYPLGVEMYERAIDILEWGRQHWQNVSSEDRGVIFEKTCIRGVKRLYMSSLIKYITHSKVQGKDCKYTIQDVMDPAQELISDIDSNPPPYTALEAGFLGSFWTYPKCEAYAALGWGHIRMGLDADKEEDKSFNFQGAKYYIQATQCIPKDDEMRASYLKAALEALWLDKTPVSKTLQLCKDIRTAISRMKSIWEKAPNWQRRDQNLKEALDYEREVSRLILEGSLSLDSVVVPESLEKFDEKGDMKN